MQGPPVAAALDLLFGPSSRRHGLLRHESNEGVQYGLQGFDARQVRLHDLDGGDLFAAYETR